MANLFSEWNTCQSIPLLNHYFGLTDSVSAGQAAYFRFRLFADEATNGWGWAIDDFYIGSNPPDVILSTNEALFQFKLNKNYPNPFNPTSTISWQLASAGHVQLTVFNVLGQKVKTLLDKEQKAGNHSIIFNASGLAGGLYFYKLKTDRFTKIRKMILLK